MRKLVLLGALVLAVFAFRRSMRPVFAACMTHCRAMFAEHAGREEMAPSRPDGVS